MATPVYLEKRYGRTKKRNGRRNYVWKLRWFDGHKFCGESTRTADKVQAEELRKLKWAVVNGLADDPTPTPEPETERPKIGWDDCREALRRAMEADNLRPSYVADSVMTFDGLRRMFTELASPADVTPDLANEYKRRRSEEGKSPWSIKGDLATLKAAFGKWLGRECGLLDPATNPFANIKAPRCDEPDVRIVSADESAALFAWLGERWNNWRLPMVYLDVAALLGWRATEIASLRADDLLSGGHVRVQAETSKTRKHKYGWLPPELFADVQACAADGYAFGRFADDLRRRLFLKRQPHHAAMVQAFMPKRLVCWLQDELKRFNVEQAKAVATRRAAGEDIAGWQPFTLHDFRRTAITGMQMAGVSEKEASIAVGCTPEVMRRHYERLDQQAIAKRTSERRLSGSGASTIRLSRSLPVLYPRGENEAVDNHADDLQTVVA